MVPAGWCSTSAAAATRRDVGVVERVERRVVAQEVGDLGRRGGGQPLARASLDGWAERASWISMSAHFSPIIIVVMHGLIAGRNGMIEPSATRSPCDAADAQARIDDRLGVGVGAHVRGARRVVDGVVRLVDVVDELVVG